MFVGRYLDWNQKRIKGILEFYGTKFFTYKTILDLGCGHADISGILHRFGSDITAVDARQEHLKIAEKKYHGIKIIKADLDRGFPVKGKTFDMILDMDVLCHLKDFEAHLKAVCAATNHLILETAVCDSDDDRKCIALTENRAIYDQAFNGMGCLPSTAAIERVLKECNMNFRRQDNERYNSQGYTYDWTPVNDGATNLNKRRLWFAMKNNSPVKFARDKPFSPSVIVQQITPSDPIIISPPPEILPIQPRWISNVSVSLSSKAKDIRERTEGFALISQDKYPAPGAFQTSGLIAPISISSKFWLKKIAPLFPNIKIPKNFISMTDFPKENGIPNLVITTLGKIPAMGDRVFLEEWSGETKLSDQDISILSSKTNIFTPSLINLQELRAALPNANVSRAGKLWPTINSLVPKENRLIFFEKDQETTSLLLKAWSPSFGRLLIVGSSVPMTEGVSFVSPYEEYDIIFRALISSKALIDISANQHYISGISELARAVNLPVISNNQHKMDDPLVSFIPQDKTISPLPKAEDIAKIIQSFLTNSNPRAINLNLGYNQQINQNMVRMLC